MLEINNLQVQLEEEDKQIEPIAADGVNRPKSVHVLHRRTPLEE
jgi:hypothetical protein